MTTPRLVVLLRARARDVMDRLEVLRRGVRLECSAEEDPSAVEARPSPRRSLRFEMGGEDALICYGAPSVNERRIFGELVPWGELWRMGANEPTTLHTRVRLTVAGLRVPPGRYSLYTVPFPDRWILVVNRSTQQWGLTRAERGVAGRLFPNAYTALVQAREVGRREVPSEICDSAEQLVFRAEPMDDVRTDLVMEWERSRLRIPLMRSRPRSPPSHQYEA